MRIIILFVCLALASCRQNSGGELAKWEAQASRITIFRDDFGVPHVYGKTDADAVFGMLYAQCEDDFNRVEQNYITAIGRLAEVEGDAPNDRGSACKTNSVDPAGDTHHYLYGFQ